MKEYITEDFKKRFWDKVRINSPDECWDWIGSTDSKNRGKIRGTKQPHEQRGKILIAPRVSYFLHTGVDPQEHYVCHSCDNANCVNPEHLWLGNNSLNQKDLYKKGLSRINHFHQSLGHKNHIRPTREKSEYY